MRRLALLLGGFLVALTVRAGPLPLAARAEIDALMSRLDTSGCEINRNGTWHPAVDARAHLMTKLGYLENLGAVETTEQFIERAASKSSVSGRPYLIRCGDIPPVESGVWLSVQLQAMRASAHASGATAPPR